ncbi:MAG: hypothetical protein S4CHLAM45_01110 [Chlamydiales bacterium]|nr:hypothetical protein [Chlamydiales bacterium]MCH9619432.1 hypothetical protein [Chlamydiales bacterium]MCH9622236.1 hypothetical protein [Chlamydiales bacterium]
MIFSLLPIYLFGNLHCISMCGPLVMLLAKHPYRWLYFVGRFLSFSLAGLLAAEVGLFFSSSTFSLIMGSVISMMGIFLLFHLSLPGVNLISRKMGRVSTLFAKLLLINHPMTTFLFGFSTVLLPCGQSMIVFSACALADSAWVGLFNGFCFALLTSPSLVAALYASSLLQKWRSGYSYLMGGATLCVGLLALLRALAHLGAIPHLNLPYHIVLF